MIDKPIDTITKADIDALITDHVAERRTLDFKQLLPGGTDAEKREFLADVSSFANTSGGDLLFGVHAKDGVPTEARGLAGANEDAETLRLESVIRDGLKPRVPPVHLRFIGGFADGPVLLMRISRSTAAPHMVAFQGYSRFFARSNAGKWQLDVEELRIAFARGPDSAERLRSWRRGRIAQIAADQGPALIVEGAKLVFHAVPLAAFQAATDLGVERLHDRWRGFPPLQHAAVDRRVNIDGLVITCGGENGRRGTRSYCQVFRDGRVEAVLGDLVQETKGPAHGRWISVGVESVIIDACEAYFAALQDLGVEPPLVLAATMIGARGAKLWHSHLPFARDDLSPIDRDVVELPEVLVETPSKPLDTALRPLVDGIWNSCGLVKSLNYGADGRWIRR